MMSRHESLNTVPRWITPILAAGLLLSSCTSEKTELPKAEPEVTVDLGTVPSTISSSTTSSTEATAALDCDARAFTPESLGDFLVPTLEETSEDAANSGYVSYFVDSNPLLKPAELIDAYLSTEALKPTRADINLTFDVGLIAEEWQYPAPEEGEVSVDYLIERQSLLNRVENLLLALSEYPKEMLSTLGVETIRIANIYENYDGHYDGANKEMLLEFDSFYGNEDSLIDLRAAVAHEIVGHGFHAILCKDNFETDVEISKLNNDTSYIGYLPDTATPEEQQVHYNSVSNTTYEDGINRTFARSYGAVSSHEDFATVIEFTLEYRGLIMPEDADYGSPLQQKQKIIVSRIDDAMPGFKSFVESRTRLLRKEPTNEIYINIHTPLEVPIEFADPTINTGDDIYENCLEPNKDGEVLVLDGGVYLSGHTGDARGGYIALNPSVIIDSKGEIISICYKGESFMGNAGNATLIYSLFPRKDSESLINRVDFEEWEKQTAIYHTGSAEADYVFSSLEPKPLFF